MDLVVDLETADLDTLKLTIELYLQDLNELQSATNGKGKRREGETTDLEVAIDTYMVELSVVNQLIIDRTMCASIANAVRQDAVTISEFVQAEEQARKDHQLALDLNKTEDNASHPEARPSESTDAVTERQDNDFLDKLSAIYVLEPVKDGAAESSAWAAGRQRTTTPCPNPEVPAMRECVICRDQCRFFDVATFPCQHDMCQTCLTKLFTDLLTDQTLFPPRCCHQPISLDKCRFLLEPTLVGRFLAKKLEYETPKKTYCYRPTCSQFIPSQAISNDVGTCVKCRERTCIVCKAQAHVGTDCPEDLTTKEVLQMAEKEGNDTNTPGVVSLEVLSSTTSAADLFTCNLQFNSICLPTETRLPSDRDVLVRFYINIELARITFNKTWDCGGGDEGGAGSPETPRPQYAIGFAEFHMACPEVITEDMTCVGPSEGVMELDGVIVEAPPPSQEEDESSG
ncbi:hypothetical protein SMACR_06789 [Sordaria macrospora]|uniref:WGS project CABT00000000 data, contig 2.3 n=2 Tax=Sordaria macrospora TaxID=5147 RepID=F7VQ10_SORMK|nr:uncharacterized protein SMAC_06789 [Sordaria macrospora k-hell]KAA8630984.1 hypothetical protein SMACR_06789 [Sordaria macrospora]WPJ64982.1 hypothetical protein SMAC4_06789 [Sordaria macrospora]CCC07588.1 unnamed protein product [Sordaria macrospora k-hell]